MQTSTLAQKLRFVLSVPICAAALYLSFHYLFDQGLLRFNYPSLSHYPVQGIDVSHHQGFINWPQVKAPEVQFAYIKASEGADFQDKEFLENWNGAQSAGIIPGAYHFFSFCSSGAEQARNFLSRLKTVKGTGLPPAVDLEFGGNCEKRPTPGELLNELQIFLEEVRRGSPCSPVLYVTEEFLNSYLPSGAKGYALWVRNVFTEPRTPEGLWKFWQFANRAQIPGISTFVDLNVYRGNEKQFLASQCTWNR